MCNFVQKCLTRRILCVKTVVRCGMNTKEAKFETKLADKLFFAKQLDNLGLERKYTGYYLLIDIMQILINEGKRVSSFSKEVYPIVSKRYNVSECTIERNIRSIICKCWSKDMIMKLNIFRIEEDRPTCCEFIYMVKNYILQQILY